MPGMADHPPMPIKGFTTAAAADGTAPHRSIALITAAPGHSGRLGASVGAWASAVSQAEADALVAAGCFDGRAAPPSDGPDDSTVPEPVLEN